jgi:hypothetical protein
MLKQIVVAGRELAQSDKKPDPPNGAVVYTLTETDHPAQRTTLEGKAVLLEQIKLECACSGSIGLNSYTGDGTASIAANTPRVTCEGQQLLLLGDNATVNCTGTTTTPSGATTAGVAASVSVAISDAAQTTGLASDS